MNLEEQKEFISSLLNYKESIDSKEALFTMNNFESELKETVSKELFGMPFDKEFKLDVDDLFEMAEEEGLEPIDYIEYIFSMFANIKNVEHNGQSIDFSKSLDVLEQAKKNFFDTKSKENIKNF